MVLAGLINGVERKEVLDRKLGAAVEAGANCIRWTRKSRKSTAGSFKEKEPPEIVGSGYVVKSLESALWAFHDAADFQEAVLKAVNLGHDTDTTGAVCGQLAGAFWGESGIPEEWREGLARRDMIERALDGLLGSAG